MPTETIKIDKIRYLDNEEFKWVKGYENLYAISNYGRIWSFYIEQFLSPASRKTGHLLVSIAKDGFLRSFYVHRLEAIAFIGESDLKVRHLDDNPQNNYIDNLCYGTHKENMKDRELNGRTAKGELHGKVKLTEEKVKEIKELYKTGKYFQRELAEMFNISRPNVANIIRGYSWKHSA